MEREATIPEGIEARLEGRTLAVKGPKGELSREFRHPKVTLELKGSKATIKSSEDRRRANAVVGTWASHIRNMCTGVTSGWEARLKVVHSHFPIKVNAEDDKLVVQNFLGERKPRVAKIPKGVKAESKKDEILVTGLEKESVGHACGNIERITRVSGRDKRIFQDGIYITDKPKPAAEEGK